MEQICPPALIYVIYMTIQVVLDIFQGFYNRSIVKIILLFLIGAGLNMLCKNGYFVLAWILVFVPFVLMSLVVVTILYLLKKKETSGDVKTEKDKQDNQAPIIIMPNNYSVQPTENGCVMIVKHDLTRHGMRAVTKDMYCPTQKSAAKSST